MTTATFETRFVAFLDVLGWREHVTAAQNDAVLRSALVGAVTDVCRVTRDRLDEDLSSGETTREALAARYSQFSDCIVLSARPDAKDSLFGFLLEVMAVVRGYLFHGFLVRGGIAVGNMYHDEEVAMGPALTEAYDLEHQFAIHPRVILSPTWKKFDVAGSSLIDDTPDDDGYFRKFHILERAADGYEFLHYLHPLVAPLWNECVQGPAMHLKPARPVVLRGLEAHRHRPRVLEKYVWLAEYFNNTVRTLGLDDEFLVEIPELSGEERQLNTALQQAPQTR